MKEVDEEVYPHPRDEQTSRRFRAQGQRDTPVEVAVRKQLFAWGLRYRVHRRAEPDIAAKADILFTRVRVAVFLDGCFWHGCPQHYRVPKNNREWWVRKIEGNRIRDAKTDALLRDRGWKVLRHWEHEPYGKIASAIYGAVTSQTNLREW